MGPSDERPDALRASGRCFLVGACLAVSVGAPLRAGTQAPSDGFVLSCEAISSRMSMADVRQRFGAGNVVNAPVAGPDGGSGPGAVIFPAVPERRAEVRWADDGRTRLAAFTVRDRNSVWRAAEGLKTGLPLAEVDLLNGRSFLLRHFEREGGGYVLSWAGGRLEKASQGSCSLVARIGAGNTSFTTVELRLVEAIASTDDVSSDDRRLKPFKATVTELGLVWRD